MLDDRTMETLVPQVYSRLTMTDDEWEYELAIPARDGLLGISGGAKQPHFTLTAIVLSANGSRREVARKVFQHVSRGTIVVAGKDVPDIRVQSVDEPAVEMWDWLKSDPWSSR